MPNKRKKRCSSWMGEDEISTDLCIIDIDVDIWGWGDRDIKQKETLGKADNSTTSKGSTPAGTAFLLLCFWRAPGGPEDKAISQTHTLCLQLPTLRTERGISKALRRVFEFCLSTPKREGEKQS